MMKARHPERKLWLMTALVVAAFVVIMARGGTRQAAAIPGDTDADLVFGQNGSFLTQNFGTSDSSLRYPVFGAVDAAGNLYVADSNNSRVLEYDNPLNLNNACATTSPCGDTVADRVFGQPNFTTASVGTSATSLRYPYGVAVNAAGTALYISDTSNNRVLEYDNPLALCMICATTADLVFGQNASTLPTPTDFGSHACNQGGAGNQGGGIVSDSRLCFPVDVAVNAAGDLYVADNANNRVLEYNYPFSGSGGDTVADLVFGQGSPTNFAAGGCNLNGISDSSLCRPNGLAVDAAGNLYIADSDNSRVLEYDLPLTTNNVVADLVFGQGGPTSFGTSDCNLGNGIYGLPSASSLCNPMDAAVDSLGQLYVSDFGADRVLKYDNPLGGCATCNTPNRVFGQVNFSTLGYPGNCGTPSRSTLCAPRGVALDAAGNLYVFDGQYNSRVLEYDLPKGSCDLEITKTASPNLVPSGGLLTSSLTVTNIGTGPCKGVTKVNDGPNPWLTGASVSAPPWNCSVTAGTTVSCTWDAATGTQPAPVLAGQQLPKITITGNVMAPGGSSVTNCATVDNPNDPNLPSNLTSANNQSCVKIDVNPPAPSTASITIIKDAVPDGPQVFAFTTPTVGVGLTPFNLDDDGSPSPLPNTQTFSNLQPGLAYNIVESPIPQGWVVSNVACTGSTQWQAGVLSTGEGLAVMSPLAGEHIICTFTNTQTTPTCDLEIVKRADPNPVQSGQPLDISLTVTNVGALPCAGITTLTDGPLPWLTVTSVATGGGPWNCSVAPPNPGATVSCTWNNSGNVPVLPGQQLDKITITGNVKAAAGTVTNCATVENSNDTTNTSNNESCVRIDINPPPTCTILIIKNVNSATNDTFKFNATWNQGVSYLRGAGGHFSAQVPCNATYSVTEKATPGWALTNISCSVLSGTGNSTSTSGTTATISPGSPGSIVECIFSNSQASSEICGNKFNDLNGNGVRDPLEPGLPNWTISATGPTGPNALKYTAVTDAGGDYCISVHGAGSYIVVELPQSGWVQTFPTGGSPHIVTIPPGTGNIDFGNKQVTPTCTITVKKVAPGGGTLLFPFGSSVPALQGIMLPDQGIMTGPATCGGSADVLELSPPNWAVKDIACVGAFGSVSYSGANGGTSAFDHGDTQALMIGLNGAVTCTFTNEQCGNVDKDGDVDAIDVALILQWIAGFPKPPNPVFMNVNGDTVVNTIDALRVLQKIAFGKPPPLIC